MKYLWLFIWCVVGVDITFALKFHECLDGWELNPIASYIWGFSGIFGVLILRIITMGFANYVACRYKRHYVTWVAFASQIVMLAIYIQGTLFPAGLLMQ